MTSELEDLILTIDTREQNKIRIKSVEDWFTGHKAVVEHSVLKHCDYRLIGEFRGISVNLGVEAKGWDNFLSDDIAEMEEKLLLATAEYDHVGFFVETQNYSFVPDENNKHGKLNYTIPRLNKDLPAKTLAAFEGLLHTISKHPQIYVTQLRGEAQFPYSLYDLLVYIQKPHSLKFKDTEWMQREVNRRMEFIGFGVKKAAESIKYHPNLFWFCSSSEESLKQIYGTIIGQTLYDELHHHEFETDEWKSGHHLDGTPVCGYADPQKRAECKTPDHFKHPVKPNYADIRDKDENHQVKKYGNGSQTHAISSHVPESIPLGGSGTDTLKSSSIKVQNTSKPKGKPEINFDTHDTHSSHTEAVIFQPTTITPSASGDTKQGIPPIANNLSPADTDLSYLNEKTEFREVKPNKLDLKKPKMSCLHDMAEFFADGKPHSLSEFIDTHSWTPDAVFRHAMNATCDSKASKVIGLLKKITEQDGRIIRFQRIV